MALARYVPNLFNCQLCLNWIITHSLGLDSAPVGFGLHHACWCSNSQVTNTWTAMVFIMQVYSCLLRGMISTIYKLGISVSTFTLLNILERFDPVHGRLRSNSGGKKIMYQYTRLDAEKWESKPKKWESKQKKWESKPWRIPTVLTLKGI